MGLFRLIGNIIWFIVCGLWSCLAWYVLGIVWCITIIGFPVGLQCFKFGTLSAFPFGKDVVFSQSTTKTIVNIIWIIFGGFEMALGYLASGIVFCLTIIGFPLGMQCFKLMKLALLPLGAKVVKKK